MEKKVLVIKGASQYNVLRIAADEVAKGFVEKGYQVETVDLLEESQIANIVSKVTSETYSFIFSCQAMFFKETYEDGTPFLKHVKSPCIGWIFDDVLHHLARAINQVYDHTFLLSVDEEMQDIVYSMFPNTKNLGGLIHGGFEGSVEQCVKDIEVLFPGSIGTEPLLESFIEDPMPIEKMLAETTIKLIEKEPSLSVRKALEKVMNELGEELNGELLAELSGVILYVDIYIRYRCRYRIMKALLENGIRIHVVGSGTNDLLEQYKDSITVCGARDITEVIGLMQRSKIVINPFPVIFYKGAHERIFTALLNQSVCFTPYSEFLENLLSDRVKFIDMRDLQLMADEVKYVLETYDTDVIQKMLIDNYEYAMNNHTWKIRGKEIVEFYESIYGVS